MGFSLGDIANKIMGGNRPEGPKVGGSEPAVVIDSMDALYSVQPNNWYSALPYGFKFTSRSGAQSVMFLPIAPSNISVQTHFATNLIPTLYGTVEEHSAVRYYDITIEGTTGISPKYYQPLPGESISDVTKYNSTGRKSFPVKTGVPLGGFFSQTIGALTTAIGKAKDIINGDPKPKTGVLGSQSGYVAFHNLYRFLLAYKKDAAGISADGSQIDDSKRSDHPLIFFNYKDGVQYYVALRAPFVLRRTAEDPHLYFYSIQLRGYEMSDAGGQIKSEDIDARLSDLGLDGIQSSSLLGKAKDISSKAKSILGAGLGGLNVLGR